MRFQKEYFYNEVREGFYISGMIKRAWAAQIETLKAIELVCKKHGIQWFADCGTLLGTIRHGGYVPWDDDLDICMLRDDYRRFHKYAVQDLPEQFTVMTYENGEYWQMITRITNRDEISLQEEEVSKYHECPYAVGIDIFVLDYLAPDDAEEEIRRNLVNSILSIGSIEGVEGDDPPEEGLELIRMVEENCNVKLDRKHNLKKQLYKLAEQLSCLYPSEGAEYVALMPFWCQDHNHKYPISYVNKVVQMPFENMMINVPVVYDGTLEIEYGDYLRIVRKGGYHDYPLYQKQEDFFLEKLEQGDFYHYTFCKEDLAKHKGAVPKRLRERTIEFCELLSKVHALVESDYEGQAVLELLTQCQEAAINIGTDIESQEGQDSTALHAIEDYCELLYQEAEKYSDGGTIDTAVLEEARQRIEIGANDIQDRREILFLPFRSDLWKYMERAYFEAIANPLNTVYVMPVPFYDRDFVGSPKEQHYDISGYPKYLQLTDYREYDISQHHPDVIYTQNAYDRYDYTCILPPRFFTSELKKHTEELVYIPHFRIGEFEDEDEKLRQTTRYFVEVPGLMHADRVLLESEHMRKLYLEVLCEFCGENTRAIWEDKLEVYPDTERPKDMVNDMELPDAWKDLLYKENGERKKTVLFLNAVCSLYQYGRQAVEKLKDVLKVFEENADEILVIWRPSQAIAMHHELFERELWLEYRKIVEKFRESGWGILDETGDSSLAERLADAYYGDPDPVMQHCRNNKKPVMIANYK